MLYLVYGECEDDYVEWHVGDPNPLEHDEYGHQRPLKVKVIIEVQADGHELEYIQKRMSNLPTASKNRVVSWFGDHAKFIAANLFLVTRG